MFVRPIINTSQAMQLMSTKVPIVVYDTETSGLSVARGDRIIQFSGILLINSENTYKCVENINVYINPGYAISEKITDITGITNAMLATEKSESEIFPLIKAFLSKGKIFCGYNVAFDNKFLCDMYNRNDGIDFAPADIIDPFILSKELVDMDDAEGHRNLESIAKYYAVTVDGFHNSLIDVMNTVKVLFAELQDYSSIMCERNKTKTVTYDVVSMQRWTKSKTLDRLYITVRNTVTDKCSRIHYDLYKNGFETYDICDLSAEDVLQKMNELAISSGAKSFRTYKK